MRVLRRLLPRRMAAQMTAILVATLLVAHMVTFLCLTAFGGPGWLLADPLTAGGQVGMLVRLYDAAPDAATARAVADGASGKGLAVSRIPSSTSPTGVMPAGGAAGIAGIVLGRRGRILDDGDVDGVKTLRVPGRDGEDLLLRIDVTPIYRRPNLIPFFLSLLLVGLGIVALGAYAVRWVTAPLSTMAGMANSYGVGAGGDALPERGPREIVQVASALNGMRRRVGAMIEERTRMLAAVGHDIRTPLTRLRLRVEQVSDPALRDGMAREVGRIDAMLRETLTFLGEEERGAGRERVDVGSLVATVCEEFSDVGHDVAFEGGSRGAVECRPTALARIVTNLVENAVRHGGSARARLVREAGGIVVEVADRGPGIPEGRREESFEPFRTGDASRTGQGFGLGLSIARGLARGMGGDVVLADAPGGGLLARVALPLAPPVRATA